MMEQNADFSACLLIHYKSWFVSKPIAPLHSFHQSGIRFVLFHLITNRSLRQVSRLGGLSKIPYRSSTLKSIFRGTADDCQSSNSILIFLLSLFLDDTNSWPNNSAERWKFAFTHGSPTIDHPNSNRLQFSTAVASIPEPSDTNLSNSNGPNGCNDQMTWIRRPLMINRNFFFGFFSHNSRLKPRHRIWANHRHPHTVEREVPRASSNRINISKHRVKPRSNSCLIPSRAKCKRNPHTETIARSETRVPRLNPRRRRLCSCTSSWAKEVASSWATTSWCRPSRTWKM